MEIGLKERLIGAVVLVVVAVIVIPWALKGGSAPDTTVTKTLSLPPAAITHAQSAYHMELNNPAGGATASSAPAAASQKPLIAAEHTTRALKPAAAPAVPKAAAKPAPERARSSLSAATGGWVVQAGSYGNEANARSVQGKLVKHGYHAYISRFRKGGRTYYRVRVGPYKDRESAEHVLYGVSAAFGGRAEVVPNS
jgi:DedD protein